MHSPDARAITTANRILRLISRHARCVAESNGIRRYRPLPARWPLLAAIQTRNEIDECRLAAVLRVNQSVVVRADGRALMRHRLGFIRVWNR
jgi:hypothetical protein